MKGSWSVDFTLTLDGVDHVLKELRPEAQRRIFKLVGRGILAGPLTDGDFSEEGGRAHLGGFVWVYRPVWCRWPSYQLRDKGSLLFHSSRAYRRIARWYSSLTPPREKLETITVPSFSLYFRRAFSLCKSSRFSRIERPAGQHRPQVKYTAPVQRLPVPKTPDPISQG